MHYQGLSRIQAAARPGARRSAAVNYRYPTESWLIVITLIIIAGAVVSSRAFSLQGLAIFFVIGLVINYLLIRSYIAALKRDAIQISDTQFPEIKTLFDECRQHVDIPPDTRLYLSYSPLMNAFAIGLGRPYSIILFSALVDHLDADELKYVIGHEMGHIKFGHTIWLTLIGQLGTQTYGLPLFGTVFRFFFLFWSRAAELTADRAGLVGCGHLDRAISAMVKFGAGPWLARWVDSRALAKQARETNGNVLAAFQETLGSHPMMTTRIRRLINFATSETFHILRPDAKRTSANGQAKSRPELANHSSPNGSGRKPGNRRVIRRLTLADRQISPAALLTDDNDSAVDSLSADDSPEPTGDHFGSSPATNHIDWSQAVSFNRLNLSAIKANAEQAEMWLRLGELLQSNGQSDEATLCLQRAQGLVTGSDLPARVSDGSGPSRDLAPALGQPGLTPLTSPAGDPCPTCGTLNRAGIHYCYQCRSQLQKPCLQCHTWIPANHPNCFSCGQNQSQMITALKAEAQVLRKIAQQPLPPRRLTKWELIFGSILLIDVLLVLSTLAWQNLETFPDYARLYLAGAIVSLSAGVAVAIIWSRSRARRFWRLFDEIDDATGRYNEIGSLLARQEVHLDPPHLAPHDPWRWAHHDWSRRTSRPD
jgi:Zn-dependent protease with chaperone function